MPSSPPSPPPHTVGQKCRWCNLADVRPRRRWREQAARHQGRAAGGVSSVVGRECHCSTTIVMMAVRPLGCPLYIVFVAGRFVIFFSRLNIFFYVYVAYDDVTVCLYDMTYDIWRCYLYNITTVNTASTRLRWFKQLYFMNSKVNRSAKY